MVLASIAAKQHGVENVYRTTSTQRSSLVGSTKRITLNQSHPNLNSTLPVPGPNDAIATWPNRASSRILILSQCEGGAAEEPKFVRSIYATLEDRFDDVPPFNELTFVKKSILDPGQSGNIQALIAANSLLSESPAAEDSGEEGSGGKERVAKGIDFSVYASDGAKNMACKRRTPLVTKNPELVGMTSEILEFIRADASKQQTATATPYERSLSVLRCWPVKLELCGEECERREDGGHVDSCMYQLKGAHLLGPSTLRNVKEALQNLQRTGEVTCNKLERFRENKKLCAVRELMKVPYVGLGTATKWVGLYEGTHKLDDIADLKVLDERYGIVGMNDNIHVCLEHIDDILQKMPRELCKQVVESYLEPVFDQLNLRYQIVGGYRRGKPSGHDIDILLTSKDPPDLGLGPFPKVVPIGSVSDPYNSHEVLEVLLNAVDKCPHIDLVSRLRAGAGQYGSGGEALGVGLLLLRFPELENTVR